MFIKGIPKTEEWKKKVFTPEYAVKMSLIMKGKQNSLGYKQPLEVIEKRVSQFRGENHWGFNGQDWRYWKKQALLRDNYTCQSCGLKESEIMEVDHILSKSLYPGLKFALENLITLCPNCHRRKTIRDIKNRVIKFKPKKITLLEA
jgi:5-methylcytosine-specific restriction protein A